MHCTRGFDAVRCVESVCVIWEEVSVNVLQSAVELSVVVDELLTCGRVESDVMYVEDACKDVPPAKLVHERGRSSRSKSTRVGNKGDNGDRSSLTVDVKCWSLETGRVAQLRASGTDVGGAEVGGFVFADARGARFDSSDGSEGRSSIAGFKTEGLSPEAGEGGTTTVVAVTGAGCNVELWKDDVCVDARDDVCGDVKDGLICGGCSL